MANIRSRYVARTVTILTAVKFIGHSPAFPSASFYASGKARLSSA
jgi:hypothetical protein